jgi:glucose-1-phosphate cytidylyltransferase
MNGCVRAARDNKLYAVPYDGFWAPMDTLKERTALEEQYHNGTRPWALWLDRPVDRSAEPGRHPVDGELPASTDEAV